MRLAILALLIAAAPLAACASAQPTETEVQPTRSGHDDARVGQVMAFSAIDLRDDNEPPASFDVSTLQGKVVLVDFWASWCQPCRKTLPFYDTLRAKYADQGFDVVTVSVDEDRDLAYVFLQEVPEKLRALFDADQVQFKAWGISEMPTAFLLDRTGRIAFVHQGVHPGSEAELEAALTKLLAK